MLLKLSGLFGWDISQYFGYLENFLVVLGDGLLWDLVDQVVINQNYSQFVVGFLKYFNVLVVIVECIVGLVGIEVMELGDLRWWWQ